MSVVADLKGLLKKDNPNHAYERLREASRQARLPYDRDVWINVAFYLNEQYVEWASEAFTLRRIPREERFLNTPRPVANKIMHFVNQSQAMALQDEPTIDVMPATDDPIAISDTAVMNAYLTNIFDPARADFSQKLSDATLWAIIGGEGYLKWIYNPRKKRPDVVSCSPLDIYADPYATHFADNRYIIHSQFMDVEQVYDIWGVEVKPDDTDQADPLKARLLQQMGSAPVLAGCVVNELWMKPCRRYPDGLYCVWTRKTRLVEPRPFPYRHGKLPFTQIGVLPRPNSQHYSSSVKYLISGQMELNKYHAQKIIVREAFANPKWWIPAEMELETMPDDSPRQILVGQSQGGQFEPKIISPSVMPDNKDGEWIAGEMMDIVGLHEFSQAQVPGRVEAAKAISLLKESDVSRLSALNRTIKTAISDGGWQMLQLAGEFVPDGEIVQTYSREGMPEVRRWRKDSVKPGIQVNVTMGTGLASSRAARQDQLILLWQNGIIRDPETMAQLMDVPVPTFVESNMFDIRLARNENLEMAEGTAIKPNSWDNHPLHTREHNNFRKTGEFMLLDTETKQKFEFHCQTHDELYVQQMTKQIQMATLAQQAAQAQQSIPPAPTGDGTAPPQAGSQDQTPQQQGGLSDYTAHNLERGTGDATGHHTTDKQAVATGVGH